MINLKKEKKNTEWETSLYIIIIIIILNKCWGVNTLGN